MSKRYMLGQGSGLRVEEDGKRERWWCDASRIGKHFDMGSKLREK